MEHPTPCTNLTRIGTVVEQQSDQRTVFAGHSVFQCARGVQDRRRCVGQKPAHCLYLSAGYRVVQGGDFQGVDRGIKSLSKR